MIPLRDENPTSTTTWMTIFLIASNIIVFLFQWMLPDQGGERLVMAAALIPARLTGVFQTTGLAPPLTLLSSQFLHGGLLHLGGNMLFLWIFGNNVEDELGSFRFLVFYLACGVAAGLVHFATGPNSTVPTIGASGAISGVLGAYALLFPRARIHTLVVLVFWITVIPVPAILWVGLWLALQLLQGLSSYGADSGVAWFAHIGGLVGGLLLLPIFRRVRRQPKAGPFSGSWFRR